MKRSRNLAFRWLILWVGGGFFLSAFLPGTAAAQTSASPSGRPPAFEIRLGTMAPPNTAWTNLPVKLLIPLIQEATGERVKITLYMSGLMGNDSDVLEKMGRGELEGCGCISNGTLELAPELSVFSLPFFFSSYPEVNHVFSRLRGRILSLFNGKGVILAALVDSGFYYLYSASDPSSLLGIRQQTIGSWWGNFESEVLKELELDPVPLPAGEILPALKAEIVDGVIAPPSWILASQTFTELKYRVEQPFFYSPGSIVISRKALDRMAGELQKNEKEFNNLRQDFRRFQKGVNPEAFFRERGISDDQLKSLGKSLLGWLKGQEIKSPEDLAVIMIQLFKRSEKTWTQMLRDFENESQQVLMQNGIKPVKLSEQDVRELGKTAQKIQAGLIGRLYSREFLDEVLQSKRNFGEETLQELY